MLGKFVKHGVSKVLNCSSISFFLFEVPWILSVMKTSKMHTLCAPLGLWSIARDRTAYPKDMTSKYCASGKLSSMQRTPLLSGDIQPLTAQGRAVVCTTRRQFSSGTRNRSKMMPPLLRCCPYACRKLWCWVLCNSFRLFWHHNALHCLEFLVGSDAKMHFSVSYLPTQGARQPPPFFFLKKDLPSFWDSRMNQQACC